MSHKVTKEKRCYTNNNITPPVVTFDLEEVKALVDANPNDASYEKWSVENILDFGHIEEDAPEGKS